MTVTQFLTQLFLWLGISVGILLLLVVFVALVLGIIGIILEALDKKGDE